VAWLVKHLKLTATRFSGIFRNHQVESVAFVTKVNSQQVPLHPSLAIVARRCVEDIVIRYTGQIVGSVEEGVAELYQSVFGCDHRGLALGTKDAEEATSQFWTGLRDRE
jgi:hypothetical protein